MSHTTCNKKIQENIISYLHNYGLKTKETIIQELNLTDEEFMDNFDYLLEIKFINATKIGRKVSGSKIIVQYGITKLGIRYLYPDLFIS